MVSYEIHANSRALKYCLRNLEQKRDRMRLLLNYPFLDYFS